MTDDEVLRVAQELSVREWATLSILGRYGSDIFLAGADATLVKKGALSVEGNRVMVTALGYRVLEWQELFR